MKIFLLCITGILLVSNAIGQELPVKKLVNLVLLTQPKAENFFVSNGFSIGGYTTSNDTTYTTYTYSPGKSTWAADSMVRSVVLASCNNQFDLTYHTTSLAEYTSILTALKKQGYQCDYENDETIKAEAMVYQFGDRTAEICFDKKLGKTCYCIKLHRQPMPDSEELQSADDLLKFTSHEYLVHHFGAKHVKKDFYYFAANDIVNCSVLFMNTSRQVIFVWKDELNRRYTNNLIFGGHNRLKSQPAAAAAPLQNQWRLQSGLRTGMHLVELEHLNKKEILFCGGNAPNPGLVLAESSGAIDFVNADVVLSCVNCTDEKFMNSQVLHSGAERNSGRIIFVQSIVLYPANNP